MICGGAALTRKYVEDDLRREYTGGIFYADDAFAGLHMMEDLASPNGAREKRIAEGQASERICSRRSCRSRRWRRRHEPNIEIPAAPNIPQPPFWGTRVSERLRPARSLPVHQRDRAVQEPVAAQDRFARRLWSPGRRKVSAHPERAWKRKSSPRAGSSPRLSTATSARRAKATTSLSTTCRRLEAGRRGSGRERCASLSRASAKEEACASQTSS